MWKVTIPRKIDVDNSVDNFGNNPHFPQGYVENRDIHTLSTRYSHLAVDI